jgi:hypothetical protein
MLSDIITLVLGFALILFGIQPMLEGEVRKNSSEVVKSVTLVTGGVFLLYYWNVMTKANYAN